MQHANPVIFLRKSVAEFGAAIRRTVIDQNDLNVAIRLSTRALYAAG